LFVAFSDGDVWSSYLGFLRFAHSTLDFNVVAFSDKKV